MKRHKEFQKLEVFVELHEFSGHGYDREDGRGPREGTGGRGPQRRKPDRISRMFEFSVEDSRFDKLLSFCYVFHEA